MVRSRVRTCYPFVLSLVAAACSCDGDGGGRTDGAVPDAGADASAPDAAAIDASQQDGGGALQDATLPDGGDAAVDASHPPADAAADAATDAAADAAADAGGDAAQDASCSPDQCDAGCADGACAECEPAATRCLGNAVETCSTGGIWGAAEACPWPTSACRQGACVPAPSCMGLAATCGPAGDEDCCESKLVTGGTFDRGGDPTYPATVSDFRLDRYEVTVGRFRQFVTAYTAWREAGHPSAGEGAHPLIEGSGWDATWSTTLAANASALVSALQCNAEDQTWTDTAGAKELLPINCVSWYEAMAFCAWDGGRLATEAEWEYAAAGGAEQRLYPWGSTVPAGNATLAVYGCYFSGSFSCEPSDIAPVGSAPAGDGKYGQADVAGNMWEWTLDAHASPFVPAECSDCANLSGTTRVQRGGSWSNSGFYLQTAQRTHYGPVYRYSNLGIRCARAQ